MTDPKHLAQWIAARITLSGRTQREIARDAGIPSQNFISMIASGKAKIPLRRVPALAEALDVPVMELLWMCLRAYEPEVADLLGSSMREGPITEEEVMLIRAYRFLREREIIDDDGCEIRGLGPKGRASGWARITRE